MDWKAANEAWNLGIPPGDLAQLESILDGIYEVLEPAFDVELSTVEPVGSFRPDGR